MLYRRRLRLRTAVRELWEAREFVVTLAEREFRARYAQSYLGVAWIVFTPLMLMGVFSLVFTRVADIDTGGVPYLLFAYVGLLPWTFFSAAVNRASDVLLQNKSLLNKVYCPREVFPLSSVGAAGVDGVVATVALGVLFIATGFAPRATLVWFPLALVIQLVFTIAVTLLVSIATVYVRDVKQIVPVALQLGLFATPVAYGLGDYLPAGAQSWYVAVNPLGAVIDTYRRTILMGQQPAWDLLGVAALSSGVLLLVSYALFKRFETGIADVA